MITATLTDNTDEKFLTINTGGVVYFIQFRDDNSVFELERQLFIADCDEHQGDLDVTVEGRTYTLSQDTWRVAYNAVTQWFEHYLDVEYGCGG